MAAPGMGCSLHPSQESGDMSKSTRDARAFLVATAFVPAGDIRGSPPWGWSHCGPDWYIDLNGIRGNRAIVEGMWRGIMKSPSTLVNINPHIASPPDGGYRETEDGCVAVPVTTQVVLQLEAGEAMWWMGIEYSSEDTQKLVSAAETMEYHVDPKGSVLVRCAGFKKVDGAPPSNGHIFHHAPNWKKGMAEWVESLVKAERLVRPEHKRAKLARESQASEYDPALSTASGSGRSSAGTGSAAAGAGGGGGTPPPASGAAVVRTPGAGV